MVSKSFNALYVLPIALIALMSNSCVNVSKEETDNTPIDLTPPAPINDSIEPPPPVPK